MNPVGIWEGFKVFGDFGGGAGGQRGYWVYIYMDIQFGKKWRVYQVAPQLWKLLSKDLRTLSAFRRSFKDYGRGLYRCATGGGYT